MAESTPSALTFSDAAHLLRRAGFGGRRRAEVQPLVGLTRAAAVHRVMTMPGTEAASDRPGGHAQPEREGESEFDLWIDAVQYWLDLMAHRGAPFEEKLTLFWHGHFTTSLQKIGDARRGWQQVQLLRRAGAGSFQALLQAVAVDPGMLMYLDNASNVNGAAQENWAREVLELFTLGAGHYSQADVVASARAWTGHGLAGPGFDQCRYQFRPEQHDNGVKTIFGITRNWNGPDVLTEICTNGYRTGKRDAMARHIARKLWSFFAYPDPDPSIVDGLAATFVEHDLSITELARAVLTHDAFWSAAARTGLVRSPVEFVVAALRGVGRPAAELHPEWTMASMGQELLNPPNVDGWHPNGAWLGTAAISARASFARTVMWGALDPAKQWGFPVVQATCAPDSGIADEQLVTGMLDAFGVFEPSPATFQTLLDFTTAKRRQWYVAHALMMGVLCCPEMHLA